MLVRGQSDGGRAACGCSRVIFLDLVFDFIFDFVRRDAETRHGNQERDERYSEAGREPTLLPRSANDRFNIARIDLTQFIPDSFLQ